MSELRTEEVEAAGAAPAAPSRNVATREALARAAGAPLAVGIVEDLDALEPEWNALLARSDGTVFQSFEWLRTWWRHFGEGRSRARLHVVTVRAGDALVAIAPLYVERSRRLGPLGVRRLLFVGHGQSDYLDVLVARGHEAECADALAAHLAARSRGFDVAVLEETPEGSRIGPLLHAALVRRGWTASRRIEGQCPRTELRRTWEETVQSLPINYRRETRRRLRNIAKAHAVELEIVGPADRIEEAMGEFIAMHQERWLRDGYWGAFADPGVAEFHRDVAARLARRGWLLLAFLRVDGRRCAANYGFAFGPTVSTYLGGSREDDEALRRYSPGRVLHARCMEWAVERGADHYDFMRGTEHYKYEFGARDVPNWTIVGYPRNARLVAARHRVETIASRLSTRARREAHALARTARGGWLSRATRAHLARRIRRGLEDLARVLRGGARAGEARG